MTYPANTSGEVNAGQLRSFVERLTHVHEERDALGKDLSDILKEAEGQGFDKAAVKTCVKIAMAPTDKREKMRQVDDALSVYLAALGLTQ